MKVPLRQAGQVNSLIFRLPLVGEQLVRQQSRALAYAAFYAPFLGGKKSGSAPELLTGWKSFLGRVGLEMTVIATDEESFTFEMGACPYGYCTKEDRGVCDAAMDLDRTYLRLLGGEMEILERIPDGAERCRCRVSLLV
jgi:hypothetical protein